MSLDRTFTKTRSGQIKRPVSRATIASKNETKRMKGL